MSRAIRSVSEKNKKIKSRRERIQGHGTKDHMCIQGESERRMGNEEWMVRMKQGDV